MMTDDIRVVKRPMPGTVKAFTTERNGYYTIILNENLSHETQLKSYDHEIKHIINNDLYSALPADAIEAYSHNDKEGRA